jgi:hypothetical protein
MPVSRRDAMRGAAALGALTIFGRIDGVRPVAAQD